MSLKSRTILLLLLALAVIACRRAPPVKVVNPLVDSADKFEVVYTETIPLPVSGIELLLKAATPETLRPRPGSPQPVGIGESVWVSRSGDVLLFSQPPDSELLEVFGRVKWVTLEGGFWGFLADDREKYEPLNLPKALEKEGLAVKLWIRIRPDMVTAHMWGTPMLVARYALKP